MNRTYSDSGTNPSAIHNGLAVGESIATKPKRGKGRWHGRTSYDGLVIIPDGLNALKLWKAVKGPPPNVVLHDDRSATRIRMVGARGESLAPVIFTPFLRKNTDGTITRGIIYRKKEVLLKDLYPYRYRYGVDEDGWREAWWVATEVMTLAGIYPVENWDVITTIGPDKREEDGCHCHRCFHSDSNECLQCDCCCLYHNENYVPMVAGRRTGHKIVKIVQDCIMRKEGDLASSIREGMSAVAGCTLNDLNAYTSLNLMGKRTSIIKWLPRWYAYLAKEVLHDASAERKLSRLTRYLAARLFRYSFMACFGEARHGMNHAGLGGYRAASSWLAKAITSRKVGREPSWIVGSYMLKEGRVSETIDALLEIFGWQWDGKSYGGPPWGRLAEVLRLYVGREISDRVFIDAIISMEHNGGWLFNKWYDTRCHCCSLHGANTMQMILGAKAHDVGRLWTLVCLPVGTTSITNQNIIDGIKERRTRRCIATKDR